MRRLKKRRMTRLDNYQDIEPLNANIKQCQIKALVDKGSTTASEEGPRIFALQKYSK